MARAKSSAKCFQSTVARLDDGMRFHVLPIPDAVGESFRGAKVRRLIVTINGGSCRRGLMSHADGGFFVILGQAILNDFGLREGSVTAVEVVADPAPDELEIPEEFLLVLEQDGEARARWETFTLGRRRSLVHYVASVKQEATRIKRSWELAEKIRTRSLHGDK